MIDGKRKLSCLTLAATCDEKEITTVEGLASDGKLHPMQEAFVKHDGYQCGYCTPGQVCSSVALLEEAKNGEASYLTEDLKTIKKTSNFPKQKSESVCLEIFAVVVLIIILYRPLRRFIPEIVKCQPGNLLPRNK